MKIKKIQLKNIRSYEDIEISFPEGSLLLSGDIGSGKSSILLAIEYALFGLQPGQTGFALLRNNSQLGEVNLEIELEGNDILIERRLKRGKSITNEYSAITINGEKSEMSVTELKTKIISLLNYPQEFIKKNNILFRYTVYTPQELMKQIILEDPENRLNILRNIFGVSKYKSIRDNTLILISKLKEDSKSLQGEIISLDADITKLASIKSFIILLDEKIRENSSNCEEKKKDRKKLEIESLELEKKIKEGEKLEIELEKAKVLLSTKKENLFNVKRDLKDITDSLLHTNKYEESKYLEIIRKLESNYKESEFLESNKTDLSGKAHATLSKIRELTSRKERFFNLSQCPTCLQNVSPVHKHNILIDTENDLSKINKEIDALRGSEVKISESVKKLKEERSQLEKLKTSLEIEKSKLVDLEKMKSKLVDLEKLRDSLEKDLDLIVNHIDLLKENILSFSIYKNQFRLKQDQLRESFRIEKNAEISLAELKKELELTNKEVASITIEISSKETKKSKLSNLQEIVDWLSNHFINLINFTERNVLMRLRLEFSKLFSKWFSLLVQDSFDVQLDENFTPIIINSGVEMDFSYLSGGERTAVALAYRLALNQTINSIYTAIKTKDLVILDEPTDGFSDAQIEKLRDVFQELKIAQLIVVSHEQKIEGFMDKIIKIKKIDNQTKFEV